MSWRRDTRRRTWAAVAASGLAVAASAAPSAATGLEQSVAATGGPAVEQREAQLLVQVTAVHEATGMTLLEGPVHTPDGALHVVDVTAPPGAPKVLRIDPETAEVTGVFTDDDSAFTSLQISPHDGRFYLTDFVQGSVETIALDGSDPRVFFEGEVDGRRMLPDDLAFDADGHLFITDTTGFDQPFAPGDGRVVRIDRYGAEATALASGLPAPNGISFAADGDGLIVSQYAENRIDHLALDPTRTSVVAEHPAVRISAGPARVDSNAVDAEGNTYQALHGQAGLLVYSRDGRQIGRVDVPVDDDGSWSATNLAIEPGTTQGHLVVSGPGGGFVYAFEAFGHGTRQSNGG